jgi:hypothetical protein
VRLFPPKRANALLLAKDDGLLALGVSIGEFSRLLLGASFGSGKPFPQRLILSLQGPDMAL